MSVRKTLQQWQDESNSKYNFEFTILDTPKSGQDPVRLLHKKCGHILTMRLNNHLKRYCKFCSGKNKKTLSDWQVLSDEIHNSEFEILEIPKNGKENVNVLHKKCGKIINMTMNNHINHKNGCKACSKYALKDNKYWVDKIKEIWGDEYILVEEAKNGKEKYKVLHLLCGNILLKSMGSLVHNKRGCKYCTKTPYGEKYIEDQLIQMDLRYEKQKTFDDLVNPNTGRKLRIDFWLPNDEIGIEVDGKQHYVSIPLYGGDVEFESQKYRDKLKNDYFKEKSLSLIRISNKEILKIRGIICQQLQRKRESLK